MREGEVREWLRNLNHDIAVKTCSTFRRTSVLDNRFLIDYPIHHLFDNLIIDHQYNLMIWRSLVMYRDVAVARLLRTHTNTHTHIVLY